jgi:hypothetical protein
MERSVFVELPSGSFDQKADMGRQEGAMAEKAVPSSIPLFDLAKRRLK